MNVLLIIALVHGGFLSASLLTKYILEGSAAATDIEAVRLERTKLAMSGIAALSAAGLAVLLMFVLMSPAA